MGKRVIINHERIKNSKVYYLITLIYSLLIRKLFKFSVISPNQSIISIQKNKHSIARFGDGEFAIMFDRGNAGDFQEKNDRLKEALWKVWFDRDNSNIVIGIPYLMYDYMLFRKTIGKFNKKFWIYITARYITEFRNKISGKYFDALAFRMDCTATSCYEMYHHYLNIIKIWDKRNVIVIEGVNTRFGVNSCLLNNVTTVRRILIPSKNAFDKCYNKVYDWMLHNIGKEELVLIIAGPMATILSYDLANQGYWTIDLGQIEKEYIGFMEKYGYDMHSNITEEQYEQQILVKIY